MLKKSTPFLFIIILWITFSAPYFFQNKIPYPADYQNSFFAPWNSYEKFAVPVKNNAISDVITQIYPWKHYTIEELKKGNIPWWNPYSFAGNPHLANIQSAVFSPFNILFLIFTFNDAWSLLILLQPLLAGIFTIIYIRQIKLSKPASVIGAISFMFCGFLTVWMPYGTLGMAIIFLPAALYVIEKYLINPKIYLGFLLSLLIALSYFSGHIQISFYFSFYIFVYLLHKATDKNLRKKIFALIPFCFFGFIISLIQIIPSITLYSISSRGQAFSNLGSIPFVNLVTIFSPDFFGNPVTRNEWVGHYAEWSAFVGIIPFILAFFSITVINKYRLLKFFLVISIVSLVLALDTPLQSFLHALKIPILSSSIPSRIIVLFSFSLSILAAFGFDILVKNLRNSRVSAAIKIYGLVFILLTIIWSLLLFFRVLPQDKANIAQRNLFLPTAIFFLSFIIIFLRIKIKTSLYLKFIMLSFILLTGLDSFRFAQKWLPFDPRSHVFPDLPVIKVLKSVVTDGRYYGKLGAYVDVYYRLPGIEGYDPLYIKRYGDFLASASTGTLTQSYKSVAALEVATPNAHRVLNLLGVKVIFHKKADTNKSWAYPVWQKDKSGKYIYSVIYEDERFQLYNNASAFGRAHLFYDYEVIKKDSDIVKRFYETDFDYSHKLILEEDPGLKKSSGSGQAKIKLNTAEKIVIEVTSNKPALLFLSDNYYPNWIAMVNGKKSKIFITNYSFRSLLVPEGKSTVEFKYQI